MDRGLLTVYGFVHNTYMRGIYISVFILFLFYPAVSSAQAELVPDTMVFSKAKVLEISNERDTTIPGTDTPTKEQTLQVEILDGAQKGQVVEFENDYTQLKRGEVFYLRHISNRLTANEYYSVADPYRLNVLIGLAVVFLVLTAYFGGIQGVRGLVSLGGSLVLIFFLLIPGVLQGYSPVLVTVSVASLIIIVGSYITHGFNRTTSAAVLGMIGTVILTGIAAHFVMQMSHLSGFTSEENVYLNFNTQGSIDMVGLLFGGVMIGLLGVLYDSAIGQAIAVEELFRAGKDMNRLQVYKRAIRIGREHIGALVNTLAIAYVGAALPLLLLLSNNASTGIVFMLNSELLATEIIRVLIGSIGLILAVPITTLLATYMLEGVSWPANNEQHVGHRH